MDFNASHHAYAANIGNKRMILECPHGIKEIILQRRGVFKQAFILIDFLCGDAGGTGCRMRRIGIAMEKLDSIIRCRIGDGIIDFVCNGDTTHWNGTIRQCLCHGDDVGLDVEFLCCERGTHAAKAGDDLVKYQNQAMLVTDFTHLFEITNRRYQCTR